MKDVLKNKFIFLVLAILLTLPAIWPLVQSGFFTFHDETQIANLHQFIKVMDLGQFPPRWAPDMFFTYGSPYLEFNYQSPYYLGYVVNHFGFSLVDTYKILLLSSVIIGAVGMFILGASLTSLPFALAASVLYTYTPYHAVDVYVRGTIGESFALALFPWLMLSYLRLLKSPRFVNISFAALVTALLLITHQLASILVTPVLFLISLILALVERNIKSLKAILFVPPLAILISAYYLLPTMFEQIYIQPVAPFNFLDHFPFIKQLIYSPWGYGSSHWGPDDQMSFQIGFVNLFLVSASIISLFFPSLWSSKVKSIKTLMISVLVFFFIAIFFMNVRSFSLWKLFPLTTAIQFPWRLLMLEVFLTSFLVICLSRLRQVSLRPYLALILVFLSIMLNLSYFNVGERTNHRDSYFLRSYLPNQVLLPGEIVSKDYLNYTENYYPLPVKALKPKEIFRNKIESNATTARFDIKDANPLNFIANVNTEEETVVTFNTFYYPGWKVLVNKVETPIVLNQFGAIQFTLPTGSHTLRIWFTETPLRRYSNYISLGSLTLVSIYFLFLLKKRLKRLA